MVWEDGFGERPVDASAQRGWGRTQNDNPPHNESALPPISQEHCKGVPGPSVSGSMLIGGGNTTNTRQTKERTV